MQYWMKVVAVQILLVSTASVASVANSSAVHKFVLMVTSGSSPDSSTVVSAVDQTLEQINMTFPFKLKYTSNDTQVSDYTQCEANWVKHNTVLSTVQCD